MIQVRCYWRVAIAVYVDDAAQLAATVIVAAVVAMAFAQDESSSVLPAIFKNSFDAECASTSMRIRYSSLHLTYTFGWAPINVMCSHPDRIVD